jgi:hypothetical protein
MEYVCERHTKPESISIDGFIQDNKLNTEDFLEKVKECDDSERIIKKKKIEAKKRGIDEKFVENQFYSFYSILGRKLSHVLTEKRRKERQGKGIAFIKKSDDGDNNAYYAKIHHGYLL